MQQPTENTVENRKPHLYKPGQSGNPNGRPKGARNRLGEAFLEALEKDFEMHGVAAIEEVRTDKPDQYLKVIASILPKEFNVKVDALEEMSDEQLDSHIKRLAAALSLEIGIGQGAQAEATQKGTKPARELPTVQ